MRHCTPDSKDPLTEQLQHLIKSLQKVIKIPHLQLNLWHYSLVEIKLINASAIKSDL